MWDIREYVREKVEANDPVWGERMLTDSQLYRYCQRADALAAESCRGSRKRLLRRHLAQRRNLFAKAVLAGDWLRQELSQLLIRSTHGPVTPCEKKANRACDCTAYYRLQTCIPAIVFSDIPNSNSRKGPAKVAE